jgi:type II secretory pathway pseudopilin PulG
MADTKQINKKLAGFSLAEIIIVMACLTVIASLGFGDMTRLFTKQIIEQEKNDLVEIHKALEVYAKREKKLPTNTSLCDAAPAGANADNNDMWSIQLAKYSNMPADQMCFDRWGRKRHYLMKEVSQNYRAGSYSYNVYFASVLSEGVNGQKDTTDWSTITGLTGFVKYVEDGDDLLVKYNDNENKVKLYEETLGRIDILEQYLERYARAKRFTAISLGIDNYANYIMYPKDGRSTDPGDYFESSTVTGIPSDVDVATVGEPLKATALTKILGLPEYLGTNAITGGTLWYVSNPGKNRAQPCDNAKTAAPFYPPALMVTTNDAKPTGC